jgi:hypothetical protein
VAKRRVRQPYVITRLHNGNIQTQTIWELCIEDAKKRNKDAISVKPYPNHYNVHLDYGDRELSTIFEGYSIEEVTEEVKLKYPNVKFDIQQVKYIFIS